jgi:RNase P subunit RPR2
MKKINVKTITELLEEIKGQVCDKYCRFPEAYPENEQERMYEEKCNNCPLNLL